MTKENFSMHNFWVKSGKSVCVYILQLLLMHLLIEREAESEIGRYEQLQRRIALSKAKFASL